MRSLLLTLALFAMALGLVAVLPSSTQAQIYFNQRGYYGGNSGYYPNASANSSSYPAYNPNYAPASNYPGTA